MTIIKENIIVVQEDYPDRFAEIVQYHIADGFKVSSTNVDTLDCGKLNTYQAILIKQ